MDRVLASQRMTASDLLPAMYNARAAPVGETQRETVPVVSHHAALFEPIIRPSAVLSVFSLPDGILQTARARTSNARKAWQRFIAIRISSADALPMEPLIMPEALVLLDRHYTALMPYRPDRPNLYGVRSGSQLTLRYVDFTVNRLVLRPFSIAFPVELVELEPGETQSDRVVGRVALIQNEP
jgi:hypothetical protein